MSKQLTEQWRNGTLPDGYYYVKFPEDGVEIVNTYMLKQLCLVRDADKSEVLDPVPIYDEYKRLQERLEIATKALKEYMTFCRHPAEEALKDFCEDCTLPKCGGCDEDCAGWKAKEYLERYGVE